MAKYSFEFKKKVVNDYISGKGGYKHIAKANGIPSKSNVEKWVKSYEKYGDVALMRSRKKNVYSFEKKLSVVQLYLTSGLSYQDLALQVGITNPYLITQWVTRYKLDGLEGLRPHKLGRKSKMNREKSQTSALTTKVDNADSSAEYIKELEDELYKLRLENAFLKELRRLRLEGKIKTKGALDLSAVSGNNSN